MKNKTKYTILEIAVDRQNEKWVFIATQVLNVLHDTLESAAFFPWKNSIKTRQKFTFEIAHIQGKIRFFFRCENEYVNLLKNQLYAHFANLEIFETPEYIPESSVYYAQLGLQDFHLQPTRVYTEFKEKTEKSVMDPYSSLTSSLLKGENNMEIIQVDFTPLHDDEWKSKKIITCLASKAPKWMKKSYIKRRKWYSSGLKRGVLSFLALPFGGFKVSEEDEGVRKDASGYQKTSDFGFLTSISIAHFGESAPLAKSRIREISKSFNIFSLPSVNGFALKRVQKDAEGVIRQRQAKKDVVLSTSELAGLVHLPSIYVQTPGINWVLANKMEPPHNLPLVGQGQELTPVGITNFRSGGKKFGSMPQDRARHTYVVGKTGMGKSTLLENMIFDDIQKGRGVGIIDPHGDLAEKILEYIPKSRTNDVIVFDPADIEHPVAFNMFEDVSPSLRPIVASGFVGIFKKMFENSWGPRLEYILRNTIMTLLEIPDTTMLSIVKILTHSGYRERTVEKLTDPVLKKFWINEFGKMSPHQQNEAIGPILNKIGQFLSSFMVRNMVGQAKNSFGIRWAMDNKKIVIVNLSKGRIGEDASNMLGAMMVTKFQIDAMSRADITEKDRKPFYLYVDEFQNFATGSFATILSEARKYKLNLTMANQYIDQMSEEVRGAIFGNVGTTMCFQVGYQDAQGLASILGPEEIITANDLMNLRKYQIYTNLLIDGMPSQVFSADTMPPVDSSDTERFQEKSKVVSASRMRYSKPQDKVEKRIYSESGIAHVEEENSSKNSKKNNNKKNFQGHKGGKKPSFKKK